MDSSPDSIAPSASPPPPPQAPSALSAVSVPPALAKPHGAFLPEGSIGDWHKRVLRLAFPIVLANLTQPLLGLVDTAVSGHLGGTLPLGAVALGSLFFNFVFWSFGFLRMGTTGLIAQSLGAGDRAGARADLIRALVLALAIGLVILAVRTPLTHLGLTLLGGASGSARLAESYCAWRALSAPFVLLNYVILGYLLGSQRVGVAIAIQMVINVVNIAAVLTLVYGFDAGVAGIGAATALADFAGCLIGAWIVWRDRPAAGAALPWRAVFAAQPLRQLIAVNRDIFLRTLCLQIATGWFAHAGARQGDVVLATNALLLNFQTIMSYALDGFAHAAEALVGAAVGAQRREAFVRAVGVSLFWAIASAIALSVFFACCGNAIVERLTSAASVRSQAHAYLPWVVALPLCSVLGFQLDGVFIGATRTRALLQSMALSVVCFGIAVWAFAGSWGNHGLWLALSLFMLTRGITLSCWLPSLARSLRAPRTGMPAV